MTNLEMLNEMTSELSEFLIDQTNNEIQAVNDNDFELAENIKIIIQNTLKSCAEIYSIYTTKDSEFWLKHFNKEYQDIHKNILNEYYSS